MRLTSPGGVCYRVLLVDSSRVGPARLVSKRVRAPTLRQKLQQRGRDQSLTGVIARFHQPKATDLTDAFAALKWGFDFVLQ